MKSISVWQDVTPQDFATQIRPIGEPAILKGLVDDWSIVAMARKGDRALVDYLSEMADPGLIASIYAPPEVDGRFHYTENLRRLNFERVNIPLGNFLDQLLAEADCDQPTALAAQGLVVPKCLPGFLDDHTLPILPPAIIPRMWIGNAVKVATHTDELENIACVVAGRRRFTLFPPEQVGNLYMGPFELTPAGTPISMVHVTKPDLAQYPRFADALEQAYEAELAPGDAIYIPFQWYHHVESLDPVNILVNYWWDSARKDLGSAWDAMLNGIISLRSLPPDQRRAWRAMFDHYVFLTDGDPGAHLPVHARGILAADAPEHIAQMRRDLIANLSNPFGPLK
jgi:Cupin-like domain